MATFLSLCVLSPIWLFQLPPQGRGDNTGRGRGDIVPHQHCFPSCWEAPGRSCLQSRHLCHSSPCTALHLFLVSFRGLPSSGRLNAPIDAGFPSAPFSSRSLISAFLNSLYHYLSLSAKFLWNPSVENAKDPSLLPSTQEQWKQVPSKLCKPWAAPGAAAGRGCGRSCHLETSSPGTGLCQGSRARQPLPTSTVPTCLLPTVPSVGQVCRLVAHTANQ